MSFRKAYCLHKHIVNEYHSIIQDSKMFGERSSHSQLSQEKKKGLIELFPAAIHSAFTGHAPRSVSVPMILRSSPSTAEAWRRLRSRGSHMDLGDGLEMGSPYFHLHCPDLELSHGGSLRCSNFCPRRFILFLYPSSSRIAEATRALRSFSVHYESFTSDCVYLSGYLAAFNFEELNDAFQLTMKSYIKRFSKSSQLKDPKT